MTNRRDFIKISSLASASLMIPQFLKGSANFLAAGQGKILVVIQLSGGNDGLNTIIPYRNDEYYRLRPTLSYAKDEIIELNSEMGLHPNMAGMADLWDNGDLCIINNVGYPNPNRSHFRSMDIWQSASDENQYLQTGWAGRWLDAQCNNAACHAYDAVEIDEALSLALKGDKVKGLAFNDYNRFYNIASTPYIKKLATANAGIDHDDTPVEYLQKTFVDAVQSADIIHDKTKKYTPLAVYPQSALGKKLKVVADLIKAETPTMVYYVSMSGFDTHAGQKFFQGNLLKQYAEGVKAFTEDLKKAGRFDDVMVMTFSEFGRRAKENGSKGTDHGTASNIYIMGGKLRKKGFLNGPPDLTDLDAEGDIKYKVDFRQVYSTLLNDWMHADANTILGKQYSSLGFV